MRGIGSRFAAAAPLLIVAWFYGRVSRQWLFAAVIAAALLGAVALGARLPLRAFAQRVIALALAAAAIALSLTSELPLPEDVRALKRPWGAATLAALAIAVFRLHLREPERGPLATFTVGLVAAMTVGESRSAHLYGFVMVAYLAASLLALRVADRGRPPLSALGPRAWARMGAMIGLTSLLGAGVARWLPKVADLGTAQILRALGDTPESGFGDRMWLGAMEGMFQSDAVVMRTSGAEVDYLRGAVYDHYEQGRWTTTRIAKPTPLPTVGPIPRGAGASLIAMVGGARDRYFLPLEAARITTLEGGTTLDPFGIVHTLPESALGVWFEPRGGSALAVAAPGDEDLQIPGSIQKPLDRLVAEWTAGAESPRARVVALAERLQRTYRYSLHVESHRRDPILNFLLETRHGHCEYFASALALLSRDAGVPARVAIGYRVTEKNPFADFYVVRERNAHAWVEVFLPGEGWTTFDATPAADLPSRTAPRPGRLKAFGELVGFLVTKAKIAWAEISLLQIVIALSVVIVFGLIVRWWRRRGLVEGQSARGFAEHEPPPPEVQRLLDALAERGLGREQAEPLERFARRLIEGELPDVADLVLRYAALRYGGVGERAALLGEVAGQTERLRRRG